MPTVNDLERYRDVFRGIEPWSGTPPKGYLVDWMGVFTDATSLRGMSGPDPKTAGGRRVQTGLPTIEDGQSWVEGVNRVEAAREASGRFVMITLGTSDGTQPVASYRALQLVNPMPCKLVAVEPDPENHERMRRHFKDNQIDPDKHWLIAAAVSDTKAPAFFIVDSPGPGARNGWSTAEPAARASYYKELIEGGRAKDALRGLLLHNRTGLRRDLARGLNFDMEIKLVSTITLKEVLGPFDRADYLEVDTRHPEIVVFPPFMDIMKRKVRRVHIRAHGKDVHAELVRLFRGEGWEIIFDFAPDAAHESAIGRVSTKDGVLTARNPRL